MGFHGRLGDAELKGDLLVEQPLAQHHQHAHLLRRQRRQPPTSGGHVGIRGGSRLTPGGTQISPRKDAATASRISSHGQRFRNEARSAETPGSGG